MMKKFKLICNDFALPKFFTFFLMHRFTLSFNSFISLINVALFFSYESVFDSFDIVIGQIVISSAREFLRPATTSTNHTLCDHTIPVWLQLSMDFCRTKTTDGSNSSTSTGRVSKQGRWRSFSLCVSSSCVRNVVNENTNSRYFIQIRWERMRFWTRAQFRRRCAREEERDS
jgi:hypothetical protein